MDNLFDQGKIDSRIFSFYLQASPHQPSLMIIGAAEEEFSPEGLTYHPILQSVDMWILELKDLAIAQNENENNQSANSFPSESLHCSFDSCVALIDSGTSFIGLTSDIYESFMFDLTKNRPTVKLIQQRNQNYFIALNFILTICH